MARFRTKHLQILVATDVAARGIDVTDLTHVINYNLPDELEQYVHNIGLSNCRSVLNMAPNGWGCDQFG